jgi:N-acetylmuramoyl-L-alanine amidase
MPTDQIVARRLLLGRGLRATFLLPALAEGLLPSLARAGRPDHRATRPDHAKPNTIPAAKGPPPPLVMLDPGHGGKDPGAIGVTGIYEKHVSLATAMELKRQLEAGGRYRVMLTRGRDVFIPLEDRVDIADRAGAQLFVSMHADALPDRSVRGASVYTLSNTASDAQTAALAQRENSADRFAGPGFGQVPPDVARILASLVRRETRAESTLMARSVVGALDQDVPMLPNPSRHAGFVVLKAADIPSVLVEMGFMSNPQDEAALSRPDHRVIVAQAMKKAVDGYFAMADRVTRMAG